MAKTVWHGGIQLGLTIIVRHIHMYAYFYWRMYDFWHAYIETYAHFFPMIFQKFLKIFWFFNNFILLKKLLLYIWPLIFLLVLGRDIFFTAYIFLKKHHFWIFHISYLINISPYFRTFRVKFYYKNFYITKFYYKTMKKLYMHTIIDSYGMECVLTNFMALTLGFLKVIYSG